MIPIPCRLMIFRFFVFCLLWFFPWIFLSAQVAVEIQIIQTDCGFEIEAQLQQPSCFGESDGSIVLSPDNSTTDQFAFLWLNADVVNVGNEAQGLSSGSYEIQLSSSACTDTLIIELADPDPIVAPVLHETLCGSSGTVDVLDGVSGGTGTISILSVQEFGGPVLCNGCPPVMTIDQNTILRVELVDENGCTAIRWVFVELIDLEISLETVDESCNGNGSISVDVNGGTGNYLYSLGTEAALQSSNVFSNLSGNAEYMIQVLDEGCQFTTSAYLNYEPSFTEPLIEIRPVSCYGANDGEVIVTTDSDGTVTIALDSMSNVSTADFAVFSNVSSGIHTVYVIEGEDCENSYQIEIPQPEPLELEFNVNNDPCPGGGNGEIELLASGGNGGYKYAVNNATFSSNPLVSSLSAGQQVVLVQDSTGCEDEFLINIEGDDDPPDLETETEPSCPDEYSGSIVIIESGTLFMGDYLFSLDSIIWQPDNFFEGLAPGLYTVFVMYPDGCVYDVEAFVPLVIAPDVELEVSHVSCPDGDDGMISIQITDGGNNKDFVYSLDGVDYIPDTVFTGLSSGFFTLFVRDTNPCIFEYFFEIEEPDPLALQLFEKNVNCFGGQDGELIVEVLSSQGEYEYALNDGDFQSDSLFSGLFGGEHLLLVRDALGCIEVEPVYIPEPGPLVSQLTIIDETCNDGNGIAACLPLGGVPPYSFLWSTGDTSILVNGLSSGQYSLTLRDDHQCERFDTALIENLPGPLVFAELTDVACNGEKTGAIDLSILGGTPPYQYSWSNGAHSEDVAELDAGSYIVTVMDSFQCFSSKSYNIAEPTPIELHTQSGQSGDYWFINLTVEGGVFPYSYLWSNGETTQDLFNLMPGQYHLTVTDEQNCQEYLTVEIGITSSEKTEWFSELKVFPNPSSGRLNIRFEGLNSEKIELQLLDLNGKKWASLEGKRSEFIFDINVLPSGMYILDIEIEGRHFYRKVVRQ